MRTLTENDYRVLYRVFDKETQKGFSRANGSTIEEIKSKIDLSESKIRDALKTLEEYGYVNLGIKKVRKNTYYITALGMDDLKNLRDQSIKIERNGEINE